MTTAVTTNGLADPEPSDAPTLPPQLDIPAAKFSTTTTSEPDFAHILSPVLASSSLPVSRQPSHSSLGASLFKPDAHITASDRHGSVALSQVSLGSCERSPLPDGDFPVPLVAPPAPSGADYPDRTESPRLPPAATDPGLAGLAQAFASSAGPCTLPSWRSLTLHASFFLSHSRPSPVLQEYSSILLHAPPHYVTDCHVARIQVILQYKGKINLWTCSQQLPRKLARAQVADPAATPQLPLHSHSHEQQTASLQLSALEIHAAQVPEWPIPPHICSLGSSCGPSPRTAPLCQPNTTKQLMHPCCCAHESAAPTHSHPRRRVQGLLRLTARPCCARPRRS